MAIGQALYSLMCYEDGGVVDDLLVYRIADEEFLLCLNAPSGQQECDSIGFCNLLKMQNK